MSGPVHKSWKASRVHCLAGSRANERPISLFVDEEQIHVRSILKSWREPDYLYFKVDTTDGRVFVLRHHEYEDYWQVRESG